MAAGPKFHTCPCVYQFDAAGSPALMTTQILKMDSPKGETPQRGDPPDRKNCYIAQPMLIRVRAKNQNFPILDFQQKN